MNQRLGTVGNNKAVTWLALWAGTALLLGALALSTLGLAAERASAADPAAYTVTDLGDLGTPAADARGINDQGQVTGTAYNSSGCPHAFLYENGQMRDLGTLGSNQNGWCYGSYGQAINNSGQVSGFSFTDIGARRAFLYEDGQMKNLGTLGDAESGWVHSMPEDINDAGQVVGHSAGRAFLYENGQMKDLGIDGEASGINNNGQVCGSFYYSYTTYLSHAFLYENGQTKDLGTLGGNASYCQDINETGQVVGVARNSGGAGRAFLYENGQMRDLGALAGDQESAARAINDSGQVIGVSYATTYSSPHPFVYENGQMKGLNSLIPQGSGWDLLEVWDINDAGQIVGSGLLDGNTRAFLLTPVPKTSVDSASKQAGTGETVSTATGDGSASPDDPVNTSITTPVAGTVSINETSVSQPETAGFSFFGQQIDIEAPRASAQNPLTLRFVIDSSLVPSGTDHNTMQLFRDGVRIEACDSGSSSTTASPDPCVKQRSQLADGDASITILSSHASAWNFGVAGANTPLYSFKGFFQPVDKLPTINTVKAGSAIPVRFSLGGDKGLDIFTNKDYPLSGQVPSTPGDPLDQIEQTVTASASGLSYSAATGQYTYTWKTDKAWVGQTRQLVMRLKDGTEHKASFKFTK